MRSIDISNADDVIDSRDVIERIKQLDGTEDGDEKTELAALVALAEEGESSPDWSYGETLIRDTYFKEYAQELADDIGAIDRNAKWPVNCIDWEEAASQLQQDYTSIDFDGVTYWIRS